MNAAKRKKLERAGWKVGTAEEFLNLSPEEAAYVEVKLNLAKVLSKQKEITPHDTSCIGEEDQIQSVTRLD